MGFPHPARNRHPAADLQTTDSFRETGSVPNLLIFLRTHGMDTPGQVRRHSRMVQL
jgi:hypothetical protein